MSGNDLTTALAGWPIKRGVTSRRCQHNYSRSTPSGVQVQDVNRLLKQFADMQRVMKSMKGGKLRRMMGAMKGGGLPPGFPQS